MAAVSKKKNDPPQDGEAFDNSTKPLCETKKATGVDLAGIAIKHRYHMKNTAIKKSGWWLGHPSEKYESIEMIIHSQY